MAGMVERTDREHAANVERMMRGEAAVNESHDTRYFDFVRNSAALPCKRRGNAASDLRSLFD